METTSYEYNSLGFNLRFTGPKLAEDINRIAGEARACEEAYMLNYYAYQVRNPQFREAMVAKLEEATGEKRTFKETGKKTREGSDGIQYTETEAEFLNRLVKPAEGEAKISSEEVSRLAQEVNEELGDYKAPTAGRSGKPAAKFYEKADEILARIQRGDTTAEKVQSNIEGKLSASFVDMFGDFNRDNLARAVKELHDRATRAASSDI